MEIKGKVHCFFEQSGTFKNEFIKLGIPAEDYDIQNNFGQTDHVIDIFAEIEKAYEGGASIFNTITKEDLIMAFFPCIYFCESSMMLMTFSHACYNKLTNYEKLLRIIEREENRSLFYKKLLQLCFIVEKKGCGMIVENPYTQPHFLNLTQNFPYKPFIDKNRHERGDFFVKPTQFFFVNCERTFGYTRQVDKEIKKVEKCKDSGINGVCSEERSMISPDYARNFICDNILGITQRGIDKQTSIFDFLNE